LKTKYTDTTQVASEKPQWKRDDVATKIIDFERAKQEQS